MNESVVNSQGYENQSNIHDTNKPNTFVNAVKEYKELFALLCTYVAIFPGFYSNLFGYIYSVNAEEFYGIPKLYFCDSVQSDRLIGLAYVILCCVIFLSPPLIKKWCNVRRLSRGDSFGFSLLLTAFVLMTLSRFCITTVARYLDIKQYGWLLLSICIVLSLISGVIYYFVFRKDFHADEKSETKQFPKQKKTDRKSFVLVACSIVTTTLMILPFVVYWLTSANVNPEHNKKYEIIHPSNSEYNVVVGYYKDSVILMKGELIQALDCENNKKISLIIKRGQHKLEKLENKELIYQRFDSVEVHSD